MDAPIEINSVVQIKSKGILDKSLNGLIGYAKEVTESKVKVGVYYQNKLGENAFVKDYDIPIDHLFNVGMPDLKPIKK